MNGLKGDFTGFTFNGVHSSDLGITHVSEGDRYKDMLVPEIEDKTVEIPGLDGIYFYGSNFKSKNFSISIAFDGVTETQLRQMRTLFGYKHTGLLSFDEAPYKQYQVKVASAPEFEYICFDERKKVASTTPRDGVRVATREEVPYDTAEDPDNLYTNVGIDAVVDESVVSPILQNTTIEVTREQVYPWEYVQDNQGNDVYERIYKGEGTIEFIAYYPFAKQLFRTLSEYRNIYTNVDEWAESSGLLETLEINNNNTIDVYQYSEDQGIINVYNPGDVETGFRLYIPFITNTIPTMDIYYKTSVPGDTGQLKLHIDEITRKENNDMGIQINTINGLIEGIYNLQDSKITSGTLYNETVTGEFFKIQPCEYNNPHQIIIVSDRLGSEPETDPESGQTIIRNAVKIFYDYLYF